MESNRLLSITIFKLIIFVAIITFSLQNVKAGEMYNHNNIISKIYSDFPEKYHDSIKNILDSNKIPLLQTNQSKLFIDYIIDNFSKYYNDHAPFSLVSLKQKYYFYICTFLPESMKTAQKRYYGFPRDTPFSQRVIAYFMYNIDRSPENLSTLFKDNKKYIFNKLDGSDYINFGFSNFVEKQIKAYRQIVKSPSYKEELTKELTTKQYPSFWARRNQEGNMKTVYNILIEIQKNYKKDKQISDKINSYKENQFPKKMAGAGDYSIYAYGWSPSGEFYYITCLNSSCSEMDNDISLISLNLKTNETKTIATFYGELPEWSENPLKFLMNYHVKDYISILKNRGIKRVNLTLKPFPFVIKKDSLSITQTAKDSANIEMYLTSKKYGSQFITNNYNFFGYEPSVNGYIKSPYGNYIAVFITNYLTHEDYKPEIFGVKIPQKW